MKPKALLIDVGRAAIVDEEALYAALKDGRVGGGALDVEWRYFTAAKLDRRGSRGPFHELPNVLMIGKNDFRRPTFRVPQSFRPLIAQRVSGLRINRPPIYRFERV